MPDPHLFPIPTSFTTPRLTIRAFRSTDAAALHEVLLESRADLQAHLWFLPWVAAEPTLESAQLRCRTAEAQFLLRTDLPYLVFDTARQRLVASVGLHRTDWAVPKTEVGYWVRSTEAGKGYVSEAVNTLTAWALDSLGATRVALVTDEGNAASRAVAMRCGFALEGVQRNVLRGPDGVLRHSCLYAKLPTAA
jgi:RimJ/RimL family protein N-acetyltransferase